MKPYNASNAILGLVIVDNCNFTSLLIIVTKIDGFYEHGTRIARQCVDNANGHKSHNGAQFIVQNILAVDRPLRPSLYAHGRTVGKN